jgi:hypothetical protein
MCAAPTGIDRMPEYQQVIEDDNSSKGGDRVSPPFPRDALTLGDGRRLRLA